MKFKHLQDHKDGSLNWQAQIVPWLYAQALEDGEENSIDHPDKLIEDASSLQRNGHREFLKEWKQHKLCKRLSKRKQIQKKRFRKQHWQKSSLQSEYIAAYQNIGQVLLLLPIEILKVLRGLQKWKTLDARHNNLAHQRALPSKNKALCQGRYSQTNILLQLLKPLLTKQWLSLLQKDGAGIAACERLELLTSLRKPSLFLSIYSSLKIDSNKTCLNEVRFRKECSEKTYFREIQEVCFHGIYPWGNLLKRGASINISYRKII